MGRYTYRHRVSIGDTNIMRSVYFTRYLEWIGHAREEMMLSHVPAELLKGGEIILITRSTAISYLKEFDLYDIAEVSVTIGGVRPASGTLYYRIGNGDTGELMAACQQRVVFVDSGGKPTRIPRPFWNLARLYREEDEEGIMGILSEIMAAPRALPVPA